MQRDTESADAPETNAAASNDTVPAAAVTTTTEADKSAAEKIEQKVIEQIQNCKTLKIFGIANYYIHVTFPCDNVTVF
jgi:hypothetical protein